MPDWARSRPISAIRPARCLRSARRVSRVARAARSSRRPPQAGLAYGLTGLMRALPVHAASGRVYLPGRCAPPPRHLAGSGAGRADERWPPRRAGRAARQGEGGLAEARRHVAKLERRRAPPSCRSAWLTLISRRWRGAGAIRCARSPRSIRSTGCGAWRAGADRERRTRRWTSGRSNPGGSAAFPMSAPPPRAFPLAVALAAALDLLQALSRRMIGDAELQDHRRRSPRRFFGSSAVDFYVESQRRAPSGARVVLWLLRHRRASRFCSGSSWAIWLSAVAADRRACCFSLGLGGPSRPRRDQRRPSGCSIIGFGSARCLRGVGAGLLGAGLVGHPSRRSKLLFGLDLSPRSLTNTSGP